MRQPKFPLNSQSKQEKRHPRIWLMTPNNCVPFRATTNPMIVKMPPPKAFPLKISQLCNSPLQFVPPSPSFHPSIRFGFALRSFSPNKFTIQLLFVQKFTCFMCVPFLLAVLAPKPPPGRLKPSWPYSTIPKALSHALSKFACLPCSTNSIFILSNL